VPQFWCISSKLCPFSAQTSWETRFPASISRAASARSDSVTMLSNTTGVFAGRKCFKLGLQQVTGDDQKVKEQAIANLNN